MSVTELQNHKPLRGKPHKGFKMGHLYVENIIHGPRQMTQTMSKRYILYVLYSMKTQILSTMISNTVSLSGSSITIINLIRGRRNILRMISKNQFLSRITYASSS